MRVSVVGTGYVGLVSAACLADVGHEVVCVDTNEAKVRRINAGESPIYEKGLSQILQRNLGIRLRATLDLAGAINASELTLVAVGTPFVAGVIDLQYVIEVSREIGEVLKDKADYHVVVVKSTVVPGTTDEVVLPLLERYSGKIAGADFGVGMNPEFLREGEAILDFMKPDRIVLGGIDTETRQKLTEVYAPFASSDQIATNNKTAEMIKYASNSLLATLISFSNEIGNLCGSIGGVDALEVMQGLHLDKRLCPILADGTRIRPAVVTYLEAGCGFGGSCFPKDVKALISYGVDLGEPMSLLKSVIEINDRQPRQVIDRLRRHYADFAGRRIAVLGLAFKPGTDDMRESPAIPIVRELLDGNAVVNAYDPVAQEEAKKIFSEGEVAYCSTMEEAVDGVEAILLLTRWEEFTSLPDLLKRRNVSPIVVDGRRLLAKDSVEVYEGIGI